MFDSVRTRLTLWYVAILALVIIVFALLTYFFTVRVLNRDLDSRLEEMSRNFKVALEAEQGDEEENRQSEQIISETLNEFGFRDYQFAVFAGDSRLIASTVNFTLPKGVENSSSLSDREIERETFRIYVSPLEIGQNHYRLLIFHSLKEQETFENRLTRIFFAAVPLALLLAGLGGYFLARKSLAPIVEMSRQASQIGATNLHERLPVANKKDELGTLAATFNLLLSRLENSFAQQRRFMADASHELRTPLAIVRGESEVALSKNNRNSKDYRESLSIVHDESKRLTRIVEDLFTLARADSGQFQTDFKQIYLDEILADCVRAVRVLAEKRKISIQFDAAEEMPLQGDEQLLHRLCLNLLDNAVKYNREGGTIKVETQKIGGDYRITFSDTGIGILTEEQPRIFERFYRADLARSRAEETETSGAGLGLAIADWIAGLHQGKIELISSDEKGSVFAVVFKVLRK
ncbi:MAG: ATP-binding protein [Actinomycetota bacterium]